MRLEPKETAARVGDRASRNSETRILAFEVQDQVAEVEHGAAALHLDKQIDVAIVARPAIGHRAKHVHIMGAVASGNAQDVHAACAQVIKSSCSQ